MNYMPEIKIITTDIQVMCIKAVSFPEGVHDAHEKLHALFAYKVGRTFYGVSYPDAQGKIVYAAGTNEIFTGEAATLNLPIFTIKKGIYNSILIKDYYKDIPIVGRTFNELLKKPRLDPNGYCLEIYPDGHNSRDVLCLVKLLE